jgi:hypothetical protein
MATDEHALLNGHCCRILRPAFFMEAFTSKPGPFVAGVFTVGLKPETKVHLTVWFRSTHFITTLLIHKLARRGYWTRCR